MANPNPSRLAYPKFPEPLTAAAIHQLFTPGPDVRWVWQSSSSPEARLGLLCLLKAFPVLGRFAAPEDVPALIVAHIAERVGLKGLTLAAYPKRTPRSSPLRPWSASWAVRHTCRI